MRYICLGGQCRSLWEQFELETEETSADTFARHIRLVKSCQFLVKMTDKSLSKDPKIIFFTQKKVLFNNCLLFVSVVTSSKLTKLSKI